MNDFSDIEEEFSNRELSTKVEIEQEKVVIRDEHDNYPLEVYLKNGNATIMSPAGLVCETGLTYEELMNFLNESIEKILTQIEKYELDENKIKELKNIVSILSS